ncbi:hypothetical protein Slin15195_G050680 [Septoria linicola]|uniref:Lytic polysaccharide monooxygenase n=1 Tax=Septoria linicola TaxID=215465 RepID=A0A9Q9EJ28_9PEZI|nr:hypothetical protein Slin15195_G050680 [Septoria linicola]
MFTKTFLTAAAACSLLVSSVNAHMVITSPVPYGVDSLNNSPLEPDGSDFPCKQRSGVYDISTTNEIPVGVPQKLSFKGGATHGGGSCQLSVTLDKNPNKNSQWKVIHSILGGCPNSDAGNANGSPTYNGNPTFEYSMPQGMPNGEYTMAWTWFNKIGNREMYMNCAPIKVTGGADNNDVLETLPDMFVANIGNGCTTSENQDFVFPQCGLNVETAQKTALGSATQGTCAAATGGAGGSSPAQPPAQSTPASSAAVPTGYGSGSGASKPDYGSSAAAAPTAPSYGGGSGSGTTSAAVEAPAPTSYGGASSVEAGGAAGGVATTFDIVTETAVRTITANGPAPSGYASPSKPSSAEQAPAGYGTNKGKTSSSNSTTDNGNSTSPASGAVPCTTQDEILCMPGNQFAICDNGFAVPMALSLGTSCSGGVISKRHATFGRHLRQHLKPHGHKLQ